MNNIEVAVRQAKLELNAVETALIWLEYDLEQDIDCADKLLTDEDKTNIREFCIIQRARAAELSADISNLLLVHAGKMKINDLPFGPYKQRLYFGSVLNDKFSGA